ncbi:MAG: carbohydrate kinase family protein [Caldilineaceae bacterium]
MFLVLGTTTLDLINSGIDQMPTTRGDEFTVDSLVFCAEPLQMLLGGNGAISAYALARLGAPVALASAVGQDPSGDLLRGWLANAGVATTGLMGHPAAATSTTTIISERTQDRPGNRLAFHHAGASHAYAPADLSLTLRQRARAVLVASYTLLLGWRSQGFAELLGQAKQQGAITALDIGPAIGEPVTLAEIAFLLPTVDYFICNEHELAVCAATDESAAGALAGMKQVLAAGARCAITKRGAEGALVLTAQAEEPAHVPALPVAAQTTVGAGDSFNAGFLYAMDQGQDLLAATRFANTVAAAVVTSAQGALGAPTLAQVLHLAQQSVFFDTPLVSM